jgi:hypothetical protein
MRVKTGYQLTAGVWGNARNLNRRWSLRWQFRRMANSLSDMAARRYNLIQHNRNSSRRVQSMGYTPDNRLRMLNRGGQVQFSGSW